MPVSPLRRRRGAADRGDALKGYTIAVNVYGRGSDFDSQIDPIVRVEAGRLRRAIEHYYLTAGSSDPVAIDLPKGGYVPRFRFRQPARGSLETGSPAPASEAPTAVTSIAVIPLVNLTADAKHEYFAEGLTEELTSELTRYQDFQIISSQPNLRVKERRSDPLAIGKELGVRFVLTGSVRRDPQTIKVSIQLHDTAQDQGVWGENYKRPLTATDLIAMQEEIAGRVVGIIADQWGLISRRLSRESARKVPTDMTVYDAVLRFYRHETTLTKEVFVEALEGLEKAVETDPEYGLAWAMLSHLHSDNYSLEFCDIEDPLGKALTYAQKGVALAPDNQFANDALAYVHFQLGNREILMEAVDRTIELNPNSPYFVAVGGWYVALLGEWERGLELIRAGMRLNPYLPTWFHLAFFMDAYNRHEYEQALSSALKFNYPELFWDPLMRAAVLARLGRPAEAEAAIVELRGLVPDIATVCRKLIRGYVRVDDLVEDLLAGLREAGLTELD